MYLNANSQNFYFPNALSRKTTFKARKSLFLNFQTGTLTSQTVLSMPLRPHGVWPPATQPQISRNLSQSSFSCQKYSLTLRVNMDLHGFSPLILFCGFSFLLVTFVGLRIYRYMFLHVCMHLLEWNIDTILEC